MRIHLPQLYDFITGENSQGEAKAWHDVTQLTSCLWPDSLLMSEAVSTLQLLVNAAQPEPENLVLVHCKDGRSRSGLFCVLSVVKERMRSNSDVAISYVTAHLSAPEGCIVITQDQYEFLFYFVQHQIDAMRGEDLSSESQSESGDTTLADIWTI
ncbi:receptor-type tyrosine-protein phosphatase alpha-like [Pomacea canaliculata]|nr:receptor-type tyrosine-protein phosphatase alpha-like [Pomacea canaliculata]